MLSSGGKNGNSDLAKQRFRAHDIKCIPVPLLLLRNGRLSCYDPKGPFNHKFWDPHAHGHEKISVQT